MTVSNGGQVNSGNATNFIEQIASTSGGTGTVTVRDPGSRWDHAGILDVGSRGNGTMTIENGGVVANGEGAIGGVISFFGGNGTVTVRGAGSQWNNSQELTVRNGSMTIEAGGTVNGAFTNIGNAGNGAVTVTGTNSQLNTDSLVLENGSLDIEAGGAANSEGGRIFGGQATVTGVGSTWTNRFGMSIGGSGGATLNIEDGGKVSSTAIGEDIRIGRLPGRSGTVNITNATLEAREFFSSVDIGYNGSSPSGTGELKLDHSRVFTRTMNIGTGGTLRGSGWISGRVRLLGGSIIPGFSPGTLNIDGDFDFLDGELDLEAFSLTDIDLIDVTGDTFIGPDAIFNIFLGFDPGSSLDIASLFFNTGGLFSVDPGFGGASAINLSIASGLGFSPGDLLNLTLGGSTFSVASTAWAGVTGTPSSSSSNSVPEPSTWALIGSGLIGLFFMRRPARHNG